MRRKDPVEDYLDQFSESGKTAAQKRDEEDLQAWQTWRQNPNAKTMAPILNRMEPVFNSAVRSFKAPNVNEAAFRGFLQQQAIRAAQTFDPTRGASFRTHATNLMQKAKRFNAQLQNAAYIPEEKVRFIGPIDAAVDHLTDELGREPTHSEVAKQVSMQPRFRISAKRVGEIQGLRRKDILGSSFESDPLGHTGSRDREIIALLRPSLKTEDERTVYDYTYGMNGKPKITSTNELASRMGKNPSQIARIKSRIIEEYNKYT